jgi:hypothetical protein
MLAKRAAAQRLEVAEQTNKDDDGKGYAKQQQQN